MSTIHLLLGTNLGDRVASLQEVKRQIGDRIGLMVRESAIYETAAWGKHDQPDFLNQCIELHTGLSPSEVLETTQTIERSLGRTSSKKWAARIIDIDILFIDDLVINEEYLKIPHPYIQQRRFTLTPLAEIAPKKTHPVIGIAIQELLDQCTDPLEVKITAHVTNET